MKTGLAILGALILGLFLTWFFINSFINWIQYLLLVSSLVVLPWFFIKPEVGLFLLIISRNIIDLFDSQAVLSFGPLSFNLASLMGVALLPWAAVIIFMNLSLADKPVSQRFFKIPLAKLWLIFISLALGSLSFSQDLAASLVELIKLLDFFALYLLGFILGQKLGIQKTLKLILASLIIPSLVGLIQLFTKTGFSVVDISGRLHGTFAHPNAFAFALLIALSAIFVIISLTSKSSRKIAWQFLTWGFIILLLFTFTRSAWLGLGIMVLVWILFEKRRFLLPLVIGVSLLVYGLPVFANSLNENYGFDIYQVSVVKRLQPESDAGTGSLLWRQRTWLETLPAVWKKPILGYGIGTFPYVRENFVSFETDNQSLEAHNDYLRLAIEVGLAGLAVYLLIYINILKNLYQRLQTDKNTKKIIIGFSALVIAMLLISFADNVLRNAPVQWMFWTLTGVVMGTLKNSQRSLTLSNFNGMKHPNEL